MAIQLNIGEKLAVYSESMNFLKRNSFLEPPFSGTAAIQAQQLSLSEVSLEEALGNAGATIDEISKIDALLDV